MINPVRLLSAPYIDVEWDNVVQESLKPHYRTLTHARIPIRLFDLLKGIGSVQPRRVNSSWMSSMMDYGYLIEWLDATPDLKMKITETRTALGSEMLTEVSELMGVGLPVVVVSKLFDVQPSTIHKIIGVASRRPDWECLLKDNRTLLVESKGTTNKATSTQQLKRAVQQKNAMQGDVKVAAASVLNETVASKMKIVDPPVIEGGVANNNKRHVFRAWHYMSLFSFLGDDVLSLYFEKMAKRLSGNIGVEEMEDKELLFNELKYNAPSITINNIYYAGHLYGPIEEQYIFLGIDKKLLTYRGFIEYQDAEEDRHFESEGNYFVQHSDGAVVGYIQKPDAFFRENNIDSIGVSMDHIALSDLNSIRGNSFKRYVKYLLSKCDDHVRWNDDGSMTASVDGRERNYYFYHVRKTTDRFASLRNLRRMDKIMEGKQGVLVTNLRIRPETINYPYVSKEDFERIFVRRGIREMIQEVFGR